MTRSAILASTALVAFLSLTDARPAVAMCGGNIFMTCPPAASSAKPRRERTPREPRHRRRHGAGTVPQAKAAQ